MILKGKILLAYIYNYQKKNIGMKQNLIRLLCRVSAFFPFFIHDFQAHPFEMRPKTSIELGQTLQLYTKELPFTMATTGLTSPAITFI